ncbi:hypothetical protein ABT039_22455 [Streptomyces lasiicapitis]|uniref:hypothetical protein n=1 Tax=Streptomyces lasiicapitis TaxID=1923961 RepID=UPI003332AA45
MVTADVDFCDPGEYACRVAEHGAPLVLDTWATPASMLGVVGERIDTFIRLIYVADRAVARWQQEQPDHAAHERANHESYVQKLRAYVSLLQTLTSAITSSAPEGDATRADGTGAASADRALPDPHNASGGAQ